MKHSRINTFFVIGLMITDAVMIALAFTLAYLIRFQNALSDPNVKRLK